MRPLHQLRLLFLRLLLLLHLYFRFHLVCQENPGYLYYLEDLLGQLHQHKLLLGLEDPLHQLLLRRLNPLRLYYLDDRMHLYCLTDLVGLLHQLHLYYL